MSRICTDLQISFYVVLNLKAVDKQHYNGENYPKETVEAKWEQLQYYEGSQWQNSRNSQNNSDAAFSSIASSGASSTASSSSSSKAEGVYLRYIKYNINHFEFVTFSPIFLLSKCPI